MLHHHSMWPSLTHSWPFWFSSAYDIPRSRKKQKTSFAKINSNGSNSIGAPVCVSTLKLSTTFCFWVGRQVLVLRYLLCRLLLFRNDTFWCGGVFRVVGVGGENEIFINFHYIFCGHLTTSFHTLKVFPRW